MPGSTASGFSRASSRRSSIHSVREPPETPIRLFKIKSRLRNAEDVTFLPEDWLAVADRKGKRVSNTTHIKTHWKELFTQGFPVHKDLL